MCTSPDAIDVERMGVDELRRHLREGAGLLDRLAGRWLTALAEFHATGACALDGCLSTVDWLMVHARMSRSTAFEKLRVAAELRRRPLVRTALLHGRISYSAARAITRAVGASAGVDEALIAVAQAATVADVEEEVRVYLRHLGQERPPREDRRGLRVRDNHDGTTTVEATLTEHEAAELTGRLATLATTPVAEPPLTSGSARSQKVDALMAMVRLPDRRPTPAAGRYMLHHLVDHTTGSVTLLDGTPLDPATAAAISCDASNVTHIIDPDTSEPLALSRTSRTWNTAQRRAIVVRDGGRCRFPGCQRRTTDVHHVLPWADGGSTDVANGCLLCPRHHTLTHAGWATTGTATTELTWHHPATGFPIGFTRPLRPLTRQVLRAVMPTGPQPSSAR